MIRNSEHFRNYTAVGIVEIIELLKKMLEGSSGGGGSEAGGIEDISNKTDAIYTLLDNRLVKKLWITRADYDQLVLDDEVDPETLYIVIESQSNPNP